MANQRSGSSRIAPLRDIERRETRGAIKDEWKNGETLSHRDLKYWAESLPSMCVTVELKTDALLRQFTEKMRGMGLDERAKAYEETVMRLGSTKVALHEGSRQLGHSLVRKAFGAAQRGGEAPAQKLTDAEIEQGKASVEAIVSKRAYRYTREILNPAVERLRAASTPEEMLGLLPADFDVIVANILFDAT